MKAAFFWGRWGSLGAIRYDGGLALPDLSCPIPVFNAVEALI
jgi:hypothetical protein